MNSLLLFLVLITLRLHLTTVRRNKRNFFLCFLFVCLCFLFLFCPVSHKKFFIYFPFFSQQFQNFVYAFSFSFFYFSLLFLKLVMWAYYNSLYFIYFSVFMHIASDIPLSFYSSRFIFHSMRIAYKIWINVCFMLPTRGYLNTTLHIYINCINCRPWAYNN